MQWFRVTGLLPFVTDDYGKGFFSGTVFGSVRLMVCQYLFPESGMTDMNSDFIVKTKVALTCEQKCDRIH